MKKKKRILILVMALALVLASALSAYAAVPEPSASFYAADYADVLTSSTEDMIVRTNGDLEYYCDGAQIVVVTVDFLDGMDIEDYCYKLFNDWQIGGTANNGVLLLLTIGEENYWCMTGKGLENKLTAGKIDDILWYNLEDYFAAGDYDSGVMVTFEKLSEELFDIYGVTGSQVPGDSYQDDYYYEEELTAMDWIIALVVFAIVVIIIITIVCVIIGSIKSARRRRSTYDPYVPPRPVIINPRPARKVYIPTPVHKPYRPTHRPPTGPTIFGGGFGSAPSRPASRPSTSRSFTSPGRSSFGSTRSSSSFGGGSRSRGIGRGGGGMSRGGGAGRRGR